MNKLFWLIIGIISLVVSIILNFNSASFSSFIIFSLISGFIIFGILTLIVKSIQNIKQKNTNKALKFGVLSVVAIVVFYFGYILMSGLTGQSVTSDHFRTNLFTGQCDYGGGAPVVVSDPWYYEPDCDSDAKKLEAIRNTGYYDTRLQECKKFCDENKQEWFCGLLSNRLTTWGNGPADIRCEVLINCEKINCSKRLIRDNLGSYCAGTTGKVGIHNIGTDIVKSSEQTFVNVSSTCTAPNPVDILSYGSYIFTNCEAGTQKWKLVGPVNNVSIEFNCPERNECEINGGTCTCLGDLVSETCEDRGMRTLPYVCLSECLNTQCCK